MTATESAAGEAAGRLVFFARAPAIRVAGAVRRQLQRQGYGLVPRGQAPPPTALELFIRPTDSGCWVHFQDLEAVPDAFAALLSSAIGGEVISILWAPSMLGYELIRAGRPAGKIIVRGGAVVDSAPCPYAAKVETGEELSELLRADQLDGHHLSWEQASESAGMALAFAGQGRGRQDGRELAIAADADCPVCGGPVVARAGRYGAFLGCLKFPACRGRVKLTR